MPQVKESTYLLEKYGSKEESENPMVALAKRLSLKHAAFPATLPSASNPEIPEVKIPPQRVPVFEEIPSQSEQIPGFDDEPVTPKVNPNLSPMSGMEMNMNVPEDYTRPTMPPEVLGGGSDFRHKLITALESMSSKNVITPLHKQRLVQEIQRATHDAHVVHIWHNTRKELEKAEREALDYAQQMKQILKSIA